MEDSFHTEPRLRARTASVAASDVSLASGFSLPTVIFVPKELPYGFRAEMTPQAPHGRSGASRLRRLSPQPTMAPSALRLRTGARPPLRWRSRRVRLTWPPPPPAAGAAGAACAAAGARAPPWYPALPFAPGSAARRLTRQRRRREPRSGRPRSPLRHGSPGLLPLAQSQVPLHHRQLRGGEGEARRRLASPRPVPPRPSVPGRGRALWRPPRDCGSGGGGQFGKHHLSILRDCLCCAASSPVFAISGAPGAFSRGSGDLGGGVCRFSLDWVVLISVKVAGVEEKLTHLLDFSLGCVSGSPAWEEWGFGAGNRVSPTIF